MLFCLLAKGTLEQKRIYLCAELLRKNKTKKHSFRYALVVDSFVKSLRNYSMYHSSEFKQKKKKKKTILVTLNVFDELKCSSEFFVPLGITRKRKQKGRKARQFWLIHLADKRVWWYCYWWCCYCHCYIEIFPPSNFLMFYGDCKNVLSKRNIILYII